MTMDTMPPWLLKFGPPILLAALSGGIAMYGTTALLAEQLAQCRQNIERIERTLEQIRRDMYMPRWPQP